MLKGKPGERSTPYFSLNILRQKELKSSGRAKFMKLSTSFSREGKGHLASLKTNKQTSSSTKNILLSCESGSRKESVGQEEGWEKVSLPRRIRRTHCRAD